MQSFDHILRNLRLFLLFIYLHIVHRQNHFVHAKKIEEKIRYALHNLVLNTNHPYDLVAYWVVKNLKI